MIFARIRLLIALALFLGWLGYLGYAVSQKGTVQIVSRAQITGATHIVLADVENESGLPDTQVKVREVLRAPAGETVPETLVVTNLAKSATPIPYQGNSRVPPAGQYVLVMVKTQDRFQIAGLPPSPSFGGDADPVRPLIYPWTYDVQTQLRKLGVVK